MKVKAIYIMTGLTIIAEVVENKPLKVRGALGIVPGQQQGQIGIIEAFPFSSLTETIEIEKGSYIAVADVDEKTLEMYSSKIMEMRAQKSGLILS